MPPSPFIILLVALILAPKAKAGSPLPEPVDESTFAALKNHSPFVRQIGASHSLILTGVAVIDNGKLATLVDLETRVTHVVTEHSANLQGWQLAELKGDQADPESLMAQIRIPGGTLVSVRYQKPPPRPPTRKPTKTQLSDSQLQEIREAANDPRRGFRGDGYRDLPPEVLQKLSRLTPEQRFNINQRVVDLRNQGVGSDERRRIYNEAIDQALKQRR